MAQSDDTLKQATIDHLNTLIQQRLPDNAQSMGDFVNQYFAWAPPEDIVQGDVEDLYGALLSHWKQLTRTRTANHSLVDVYNPAFEQHSWQSTHTVVDIVTQDKPFLVDSLTMAFNRAGFTVHRTYHPTLPVMRDQDGHFLGLASIHDEHACVESLMHFELDRQTDQKALDKLSEQVHETLCHISISFQDWQAMRQRMEAIIGKLQVSQLPEAARLYLEEDKAFLQWLVDDNFIFLGYRYYHIDSQPHGVCLTGEAQSALGQLRSNDNQAEQCFTLAAQSPRAELALNHELLSLTKTTTRSLVHRPAHMEYVGIKAFDDQGQAVGEYRFLGLFTSLAYSAKPSDIPLLRRKVQRMIDRSGLPENSHAGKALWHILDTFPRDELFQFSEERLFDITIGILHLQDRQRLRLFVLPDRFGRFVSCLVYVPLDHYNTEIRKRMENVLMNTFDGIRCEFAAQFSESVLVRVLFHIWRLEPTEDPIGDAREIRDYNVSDVEDQLRDVVISWQDKLNRALLEQFGEEQGNRLFQRYRYSFPPGYQADFNPRVAAYDISHLQELNDHNPLAMHLYQTLEDPEGLIRLKVYRLKPVPLSDIMPMLENLGLKVLRANPYRIDPDQRDSLRVLDFIMEEQQGQRVDVAQVREQFQQAFARLQQQAMENDSLNRLVLTAGLGWRSVVMLRAYSKYLLQADIPYSQAYIRRTLNHYPIISQQLAQLFQRRFDPDYTGSDRATCCDTLAQRIEQELEQVSSLDEDRILRRFLNVIRATLRTNFYQLDDQGQHKSYVSFKLDSQKIADLPQPRPMYEIFVYSPRVEAVHLRGGTVARGGLRWSDRIEDFRTEVLGLLKAQMVKNSVIVPVGSKGGFVVKRLPQNPEQRREEVTACYQTFIRGMLDITDNRDGEDIIEPRQVVRYDGNDPYLVVAADKGTATFSDTANQISLDYRFWLGDAFASGGSSGYDHKKMGITARGAWESVKRHFRELGRDIQDKDTLTVVGVGDMAGDVFGNGMLLSPNIRLLAAFNHLHIFIDPDPNCASSYQERQRLFELPRSSWQDYQSDLISKGGGIFQRSAKVITISDEARQALGLSKNQFTPNELIHNLLQAPVDLLWNGGIGTYVKSSQESHSDVGDKTNDGLRINGKQLRCKVVGEGGNLGLTQLGRIEYALAGGRVLTDAVDNSAGVNCSDHEVNIKILLDRVVRQGDLTLKKRNQVLADMTDEVAGLVLRQNYLQPQAISLMQARGSELLGDHMRFIRLLEKQDKLNRELENLPSDDVMQERSANDQNLTAPELSVMLAYGKIALYEAIISSDVPEDSYLHKYLVQYFPKALRNSLTREMEAHPLRREIIATYITNSLLNRMDSAFAFYLWDETGESYANIVRAYVAARGIFGMKALWNEVEKLDNQVAADIQHQLLIQSQDLMERVSLWLLRNRRSPLSIEQEVARFKPTVTTLRQTLLQWLPESVAAVLESTSARYQSHQVPEEIAQWVASLDTLYPALDITEVSRRVEEEVTVVAPIYFDLAAQLQVNWLRGRITNLAVNGHWQMRARAALLNSLYDHLRQLTAKILTDTANQDSAEQRLQQWMQTNQTQVERCQNIFNDLRQTTSEPDMAMLSVAVRELANLIRGEQNA